MASVAEKFSNFCGNLKMKQGTVDAIRDRYHLITQRLNIEYYGGLMMCHIVCTLDRMVEERISM